MNDNGIAIKGYELYIDAGGDLSSAFTKVASYPATGFTSQHQLTKATDNLKAAGTLYRAKFKAINNDNMASELSDELVFALGAVPSAPGVPTKEIALSTRDSILVKWAAVTTDTLKILGYKLYADSGHADELKLVYDGTYKLTTT